MTLDGIGVELSNADAIGAKVRVKATIQGEEMWQLREIGRSQGWVTYQSDMRPHFGLGEPTVVEAVRIEWPSGIVQELSNVEANQILTVTEPPRLSIILAETSAALSWPARAEGHALYHAVSVDGPWESVDAPFVIVGHLATVEVWGEDSVRFYRLQMP